MKEVLIISGKGGTGKTTVASSLAIMMDNKIIADTDVDAADMYIMLNPEKLEEHSFKGRSKAVIDQSKCSRCGLCSKKCRFDAIDNINGMYIVNTYACEGCTLCKEVCPADAVNMKEEEAGKWFISETAQGMLVHARLNPGAENSGNLVSMVKHQAKSLAKKQNKRMILIDGPPGIGCPVTSSLSGADIVLIVTEPTVSGKSDLERVIEVAGHFKPEIAVIINKHDINSEVSEEIESYLKARNIPVIAKIPYDENIVRFLNSRKTPVECSECTEVNAELQKIADYLEAINDSD